MVGSISGLTIASLCSESNPWLVPPSYPLSLAWVWNRINSFFSLYSSLLDLWFISPLVLFRIHFETPLHVLRKILTEIQTGILLTLQFILETMGTFTVWRFPVHKYDTTVHLYKSTLVRFIDVTVLKYKIPACHSPGLVNYLSYCCDKWTKVAAEEAFLWLTVWKDAVRHGRYDRQQEPYMVTLTLQPVKTKQGGTSLLS